MDPSIENFAAVLDMWYGSRIWRDEHLPLAMDVGLANPAYLNYLMSDVEADLGDDPLGDWHGRNQ